MQKCGARTILYIQVYPLLPWYHEEKGAIKRKDGETETALERLL